MFFAVLTDASRNIRFLAQLPIQMHCAPARFGQFRQEWIAALVGIKARIRCPPITSDLRAADSSSTRHPTLLR